MRGRRTAAPLLRPQKESGPAAGGAQSDDGRGASARPIRRLRGAKSSAREFGVTRLRIGEIQKLCSCCGPSNLSNSGCSCGGCTVAECVKCRVPSFLSIRWWAGWRVASPRRTSSTPRWVVTGRAVPVTPCRVRAHRRHRPASVPDGARSWRPSTAPPAHFADVVWPWTPTRRRVAGVIATATGSAIGCRRRRSS
jgi:hypothetical protein